jgi:peptidoglycan/LPS O-acetylase OafA/YrhL
MNPALPTIPSAKYVNRFEMLDLLRGVAALAVLIFHSSHFLGAQLLPSGYLAVDLFFMLSGFVIAHNYDSKIAAGMTLREFMLVRGIRLFPCYWLALALGLVIASARMIRDAGYVDGFGLAAAAVANLFMLPSLTPLYDKADLFPFNGVSWSLMYELIANVIYWLLFRFLNGFSLLALLAASAVALILVGIHYGTVDIGMRNGEALAVLPRVIFSFFAGLALRRYVHDAVPIRLGSAGNVAAVAVLVSTLAFVGLLGTTAAVGDFIAIMAIFPLLLVCVSNTIPGPRWTKVCRVAGNTSYPVYILQTPIMMTFAAIPEVLFDLKGRDWAPTFGIVEVTCIVVAAWWIDGHFEMGARQALKRFLLPRKAAPVGA